MPFIKNGKDVMAGQPVMPLSADSLWMQCDGAGGADSAAAGNTAGWKAGAPPEPHLMVLMTLVSNFQFESCFELSSHPGLADK